MGDILHIVSERSRPFSMRFSGSVSCFPECVSQKGVRH
jgi:hypothetical protein